MIKKILLTLLFLFGFTQAYAVDTLRKHNTEKQEEGHWYDPVANLLGQKIPETEGRDLLVINNDRSIVYNGKRLELLSPIENWVNAIGKPSRISEYGSYYWDDKGINITTKNKGVARTINIQLLTFREIFPELKFNNFRDEGKGGILVDYFKGVIQIEDGYLAREINKDTFKRSGVWQKFKKSTFPYSYSYWYERKEKDQANNITFTYDGRVKRVSIY